jgi:hypothetical protein
MTSASGHLGNKIFWICLVFLIVGLSGFYFAYSEKVVPPWDPSSMVLLAQSFAQNHGLQYVDANNSKVGPYFNPHGFNIRAPSDPQPFSAFPPGFSIALAPLYALTGSLDLLYLIPFVFSIIGLMSITYLGYVLSGRWGSLFAVLLVGTSHVIITFSTSLWADGPSLSLLLAGMAMSLWAISSNRRFVAVVAGLCLGLLILFKFVNVIFVVLFVVGLIFLKMKDANGVRFYLLPGIVAGIVSMLVYQAGAYGSPLANAYQPWGQNFYAFPLFSLSYLLFRSPPPWSDISNSAIFSGLLTDMHIWIAAFIVGLLIDRKNPLRLLLALMFLANVGLYAVSVFTPRQFINMRYLLPALAAGYLLAADVLARLVRHCPTRVSQSALAGIVGVICLSNLVGITVPALTQRNTDTTNAIQQVIATAQALPPHSVVLAYSLADSFILYGNLSVLNYRRVIAPNLQARNIIVLQAIDKLLCDGQSVNLVQDDAGQFNTIYSVLAQKYALRPNRTPLISYAVRQIPRDQQCSID